MLHSTLLQRCVDSTNFLTSSIRPVLSLNSTCHHCIPRALFQTVVLLRLRTSCGGLYGHCTTILHDSLLTSHLPHLGTCRLLFGHARRHIFFQRLQVSNVLCLNLHIACMTLLRDAVRIHACAFEHHKASIVTHECF